MKKKNLAFTLAEVLIVIGIIGVVAALTLPNLNHATGDKETVTRLKKAYSILNEANDRAVAIYGPVSTWKSNEQCANSFEACWTKRVGEFLKISNKCDESPNDDTWVGCGPLSSDSGEFRYSDAIYQMSDGITYSGTSAADLNCEFSINSKINDTCFDRIYLDINGRKKGKNIEGQDIFVFFLSDSLSVLPFSD